MEQWCLNTFHLNCLTDGALELVTPPLDSGVILPGVTRQSVLELTREMKLFEVGIIIFHMFSISISILNVYTRIHMSLLSLYLFQNTIQVTERRLTMSEILKAKDEGRLIEMFGTGTAAIISPVGSIMYR